MRKFILNIIKHKSEDVQHKVCEFANSAADKACDVADDIWDFLTEEPDEDDDDYSDVREFIDDASRDEIRLSKKKFMCYFNKAKDAETVSNFLDMFGVLATKGNNELKLSLFGRVIELAKMVRDGKISDEHKEYFKD